MPTITDLRRWRNGEIFNARDYVYERDLIVEEVNRLSGLFDGTTDLSLNSLTLGDATLSWNDVDGTIDIAYGDTGVALQVGQEMQFYAKAAGNISNGDPVMFNGIDPAQGNHFLVQTATVEALNANPEIFIGVATQDIANGEFGYITEFGLVRGLKTNGDEDSIGSFTTGQILWWDPENGGYAVYDDRPPRGKAWIRIAAVVKPSTGNSANGTIFVRPSILEGSSIVEGSSVFTILADPTVDNDVISGDVWFDSN
jgi:hypothetical protein